MPHHHRTVTLLRPVLHSRSPLWPIYYLRVDVQLHASKNNKHHSYQKRTRRIRCSTHENKHVPILYSFTLSFFEAKVKKIYFIIMTGQQKQNVNSANLRVRCPPLDSRLPLTLSYLVLFCPVFTPHGAAQALKHALKATQCTRETSLSVLQHRLCYDVM